VLVLQFEPESQIKRLPAGGRQAGVEEFCNGELKDDDKGRTGQGATGSGAGRGNLSHFENGGDL